MRAIDKYINILLPNNALSRNLTDMSNKYTSLKVVNVDDSWLIEDAPSEGK